MNAEGRRKLESRVIRATETALADHQYVSVADVLIGMALLPRSRFDDWRIGRVDALEEVIQGSPEKIANSISIFQQWARERGLHPSVARYVRTGRDGDIELHFTRSGDPAVEAIFRTHYLSPALPERKKQKIEKAMNKAPERVVFEIVRASKCSECGIELPKDGFLTMEAGQPLCLACAGLGDLEYLPRGDVALTRRTTKYSSKTVVVVRFSRTRGRYERQGILAEEGAIARAEEECVGDAAERAIMRQRAAKQRQADDRKLVVEMTRRIQELFPRVPEDEARKIASHTAVRGSGRVGRTAAGRSLDEGALTAAVAAAVRHNHTNYDELLAGGLERDWARQKVRDRVDEIIESWRAADNQE